MPITITQCTFTKEKKTLMAIREAVFIKEQGISLADEYDGKDMSAQHFLGYYNNQAVACCRVLQGQNQIKIGRLAVLPDFRRQGIARALMQHVCQAYPKLQQSLDAQCYLIHFYQSLGFCIQGPVFMDAGIAHLSMQRAG